MADIPITDEEQAALDEARQLDDFGLNLDGEPVTSGDKTILDDAPVDTD